MRRSESAIWAHRDINAVDPHLQYLRVDGYRPMSGDLDMDGFDILNVGLINGVVDIENHASRHQSGGADPLDGYDLTLNYSPLSYVVTNNLIGEHIAAIDDALSDFQIGSVPGGRTLTAGAGLTGGGDLTVDRTFDIVANVDGSIIVNANDIQVGILATDSQHGNRGGGLLHELADITQAGFLSIDGYNKLQGIEDGAQVNTVDSVFGRTGVVIALSGDYDSSQIDNDSSVPGVSVSDALDYLDGQLSLIDLDGYALDFDLQSHISDTANPHATSIANIGSGTLAQLNSAITDATLADESLFSLVDGTRPFTGPVGGVTPVALSDLATKGYVDSFIQGISWQEPVLDKDLTAPPGGEATGDRYIVAAVASGDWLGYDGYIAEYNGAGWDFTEPSEGFAAWVEDEDKLYVFTTLWQVFGSVIDHGNLIGLSDDDHTQYLLVSGTRAMTGSLDMGTNSITNVNLVDGVDVSTHASRHENGGADEIELSSMGTSETNTSFVLRPNGTGGVVWSAETPAPVSSVFGRTGVVVAQSGDYDSDLIGNASSVFGANVSDALETLDGYIQAIVPGGPDRAIQFNNNGLFDGSSNFLFTSSGGGRSTELHSGAVGSSVQHRLYDSAGTLHGGITLDNTFDEVRVEALGLGQAGGLPQNLTLKANGQLFIDVGAGYSGSTLFIWPLLDGLFGSVLSTDGLGNLSFVDLGLDGYATTAHAGTHESGGSDELDGYQLKLNYISSNYVVINDVIGEHIAAIDEAIGSLNHSSLLGLLLDDHLQYLRVDGYRPMTNNLDMGVNSIVNVISVDAEVGGSLGLTGDAGVTITSSAGNINLTASDLIISALTGPVLVESDTDQLLLRGATELHLITNGIDWKWPSSDGGQGNVLTTDGAGNLSFTDLNLDGYATTSHATTHESGGSDELDGYQVALNYIPLSYTVINDVIGEHIAAIDDAIGDFQAGTVPGGRQVIAGAGLTGGGDLTADRTFDIVANVDGSIVVNSNDIQVGVLATDAQHGDLGGGSLHELADSVQNGFFSIDGYNKLEGIEDGAQVNTVDSVFGRTGVIVAAGSDYDASQIDNDSSVPGVTVADALSYLDGYAVPAIAKVALQFVATEEISNFDQWMYSWRGNGGTQIAAARSGASNGLNFAGACSPIVVPADGYIEAATLVLVRAAVNNAVVSYPVTFTAIIQRVGFNSLTTIATLEWQITNSYPIGTFTTSGINTDFKGTISENIFVQQGQLLAVKFIGTNTNDGTNVRIAQNFFVNLFLTETL